MLIYVLDLPGTGPILTARISIILSIPFYVVFLWTCILPKEVINITFFSFPNIFLPYFSLLRRYVQLVTSNSSIYMYSFTFILPPSNLGQTFWTSLHLHLLMPLLNDEAPQPFWSLNPVTFSSILLRCFHILSLGSL